MAFIVPGVISIMIGVGYAQFVKRSQIEQAEATAREKEMVGFAPGWKRALCALTLITAAGGFIFGTMTFIIPRMFEVSLTEITVDVAATEILAALVSLLRPSRSLSSGGLSTSIRSARYS